MLKEHLHSLATVILVAIAAIALSSTPAAADRYVILFAEENHDPAAAERLIENAGGKVVRAHHEIGVVIAESSDLNFEPLIEQDPSVEGCGRDTVIQGKSAIPLDMVVGDVDGNLVPPQIGQAFAPPAAPEKGGSLVTDPTLAPFFQFQWNMRLMNAPDAWKQGHLGDPDITIAIIDSGIDYTHPEVADRVDLSRSASFHPDEDILVEDLFPGAHPIADLHFHGTFIAAMAACNGFRTACVAPNATLIGVKVLNRFLETTPGIITSGIMHASNAGADIIDIAIDGFSSCSTDGDAIEAIRRAIEHAAKNGAFMIGQPGGFDFGIDLDNNDPDEVQSPAEASEILTVISAVGPADLFSDFSNFGTSVIDMAAPGGDSRGTLTDVAVLGPCSTFTQFELLLPCQDGNGLIYIFLVHPFVASGHLAGAAALIDAQAGGARDGFEIRDRIFSSLDDIGEPGCDPLFGRGRLNIANALALSDDEVETEPTISFGCGGGTGCAGVD